MKFSLIISIIIHVLILGSVLFVFRVVPEMRLPEKIYTVKILQPIIQSRTPPPQKKPEVTVEKPKEAKPEPAKPKPKKEPAKKPEPVPPKPQEQPLDVSVDEKPADQTSLAVDAPRFPFSYYLEAIERKVSQNWYAAVATGSEGYTCVVYFRLRRNGAIDDIRIETGSGNAYFDRTALRAIRSAAPFPPLPRAFTDDYLGIHFTFVQKE
jgi:protein TonB